MNRLPAYFSEGIQFECQGSGKCCVSHGEYGYVYLNEQDRSRMAKALGLPLQEFLDTQCQQVDGFWVVKDNPAGGDCIYLKDKRCSVYEGRPTQCRTWPFWPDVLNARTWKKEVATFCPGVGKGRFHTPEEILAHAKAQQDSETANLSENKSLQKK